MVLVLVYEIINMIILIYLINVLQLFIYIVYFLWLKLKKKNTEFDLD